MSKDKLKQAISLLGETQNEIAPEIQDAIDKSNNSIKLTLEYIVEKIPEMVSEAETRILSELDKKIADPNFIQAVKGDAGESIRGDQGPEGPMGPKGDTGPQGNEGKEGPQGKEGKRGRSGRDGQDGSVGLVGKDGNLLLPDEISQKLNTLSEVLNISLIAGLEKRLATMTRMIQEKSGNNSVGKMRGGGDSLQVTDLSALLNGVTKTFTLPPHRKLVLASGSAAPFGAFRPTIDFAHTRTSLTFTSNVDAASSLAQGQSLLVISTR